ncbi:16S rRNA (guanine(527)-N(7))-methyltransferase RsmG [Paraferrimonas sedimenticola]|uniref:Ribosomal RNA small subunit methyltransferase G n=1 Tax=Paraferrimonas sedimenticola TaxID=375674 RepID=A0AA37RYU7_9GAMM|nr:ribosomal RNA small subunit methyltransferase G [Paraferrimonas sedimenticola]
MQSLLDEGLSQLGLTASDRQKQQLLDFVGLLDKWNKAYNLTSVRDPRQMMVRHIFDSLAVSPYLKGERFIDVGTGPGLPGIPLAILNPDKEFVLLDSLGKRIRFQKQVKLELGLTNIVPTQSRVEEYHSDSGFDMVLSRAFASLSDMLHWCQHLPNVDGCFMALKANLDDAEMSQVPAQFTVDRIEQLTVPRLNEPRHLVYVSKNAE